MNNDTQLKHFVWWVIKTQGQLPKTYKEFVVEPLSEAICRDIDDLVTYVKENY